jgi:hypothetical protein
LVSLLVWQVNRKLSTILFEVLMMVYLIQFIDENVGDNRWNNDRVFSDWEDANEYAESMEVEFENFSYRVVELELD